MNEGFDTATLHANLVSVKGVGVLITGEAGNGKSEVSLQLISRGHALVADDVVHIERTAAAPVGSAPVKLRQLIELKGLGIADVVGLFGEQAFKASSPVNILVELILAEPVERSVPASSSEEQLLGASLPKFSLRCDEKRDLARKIEIAVDLLRSSELIRP